MRKIVLVCFVVNIRLCIIYSSHVVWLRMCGIIPEFLGHKIGIDLCEPLPAKKKKALNNIYSIHILWSLWKMRSALCFQGSSLIDVKVVIRGAKETCC